MTTPTPTPTPESPVHRARYALAVHEGSLDDCAACAPDDAGLRQRIADALAEHRASFTTHVPTEHACCAAVVLPLVAAERAAAHEAGRVAGWRAAADDLEAHRCNMSDHEAIWPCEHRKPAALRARAGAVHQDGQP